MLWELPRIVSWSPWIRIRLSWENYRAVKGSRRSGIVVGIGVVDTVILRRLQDLIILARLLEDVLPHVYILLLFNYNLSHIAFLIPIIYF